MPKVHLCQINPIVGNFEYNIKLILDNVKNNNDIYVFPEMCLTGYPIEDLALRKSFQITCEKTLKKLLLKLQNYISYVVIGTLSTDNNKIYNSLIVIHKGKIIGKYNKHFLPNYGVFDEYRIFDPGTKPLVLTRNNKKYGFAICEDIWADSDKLGANSPIKQYKKLKIDELIVINGSIFEKNKLKKRHQLTLKRSAELGNIPIHYCNLYGGQDDLIFDGNSFTSKQIPKINQNIYETIYNMCVLGIKDYAKKNNFKKIILGLSGGIDSALCATMATDAIGSENVYGIIMPSKYSSTHSITDATKLANNLTINLLKKPIKNIFNIYEQELKIKSVALENIQARIRANIIMAHSNTFNSLALATGNKSELAMGYSTIYGDSIGGYAPLKDIYKTDIWKLAKWRNTKSNVIPKNSIKKEPSAELRLNQKDTDSLPEYNILDKILFAYIEQNQSLEQMSKKWNKKLIAHIMNQVDASEWKRRQYPIGPKISSLAFGRDRRLPIMNNFKNN